MRNSRLVIKCFHVKDVAMGQKNTVNEKGCMTVSEEYAREGVKGFEDITDVRVAVLPPNCREYFSDTVMDVIPISTKALGKLGEGITHTLTGVYVLLTGVDEAGRQITNGGGCEGRLAEHIAWGKPGTPDVEDYLIMLEVTVKKDAWAARSCINDIYTAADRFIQPFRMQMKKFNPYACSEVHKYENEYRADRPNVLIIKEVSGQGAVYDTLLFPEEPSGFEGGRSIIDMGNMPVFVTPNEYRDGAIRALD